MKLKLRLGSTFVCLAVAIPCAAQIAVPSRKTISPAPSAIPADADLPESVRAVLTRIRDQVAEQKLTFSVGYTGASEFPIEMITGLKPPANLSVLARQQSDSTPEAQAQVKQACSGSEASFDWRQHDGATPVRDQGPCGSCWAFGTHAAFEGSWRIPTHVGLDTSEQATLSCSGKGTCAGGWWAFDYLIASGAADEKDWPYSASDEPCRPAVPKKWKASVWSYVDPAGGIPAPARMKQALCRYGPVVVAVNATPAFQVYTGASSTSTRREASTTRSP